MGTELREWVVLVPSDVMKLVQLLHTHLPAISVVMT